MVPNVGDKNLCRFFLGAPHFVFFLVLGLKKNFLSLLRGLPGFFEPFRGFFTVLFRGGKFIGGGFLDFFKGFWGADFPNILKKVNFIFFNI